MSTSDHTRPATRYKVLGDDQARAALRASGMPEHAVLLVVAVDVDRELRMTYSFAVADRDMPTPHGADLGDRLRMLGEVVDLTAEAIETSRDRLVLGDPS